MTRLRYNGLATGGSPPRATLTLGGALTNSATSITFSAALTYGGGTAVPTITSPDYLPLAILDSNGKVVEIVHLTDYTSGATTGTIARGKEGTTGVAHSSGAAVEHAAMALDLPRDRLWLPGPGELSIDEFNDDSLDAAWVRVDAAGSGAVASHLTWTESGDVLSAKHTATADGASNVHGLVRPLSGVGGSVVAGDAFITRLLPIPSFSGSQYVIGGIVLSDGTTHGAGNQVCAFQFYDGTALALDVRTLTNWTNQVGETSDLTSRLFTGAYVRLVCIDSDTWRADFSADDVNWHVGSTIDRTITPTHVGLLYTSWNTATPGIITYDMIRRASGVS